MVYSGEGVENLDVKMEQICESPVRSKPRSLIVVVTEGCAPVQCYSIGDTQLKTVSVPVPSLDTSRIKVTYDVFLSFFSDTSIDIKTERNYFHTLTALPLQ